MWETLECMPLLEWMSTFDMILRILVLEVEVWFC